MRCRRGGLLDQGSILLCHLVECIHRRSHLRHAGALFRGRSRDSSKQIVHAFCIADEVQHGHTRALHDLRPGLDLFHAAGDERLDFPRRQGTALRKAAYLAGDYGESATLLAGARRLDGSIQRQDVGLKSDTTSMRICAGVASPAVKTSAPTTRNRAINAMICGSRPVAASIT